MSFGINLDGTRFECSCPGCRSGNPLLHAGCFGDSCKRLDSARSAREVVADGEDVTRHQLDSGRRSSAARAPSTFDASRETIGSGQGFRVDARTDLSRETNPLAERAAMIERNQDAWRKPRTDVR